MSVVAKNSLINRNSRILMNDGNSIPVYAVGTFQPEIIPPDLSTITNATPDQINAEQAEEAVKAALEAGFRHVDGAFVYLNEKGVGKAFKDTFSKGEIKRKDVFYTTKLWSTFHRPELVRKGLERSLALTNLSYVDLYLIHIPFSIMPGEKLWPLDKDGNIEYDNVDLRKTWEAMEECKDAGLAKSIGVANFNIALLKTILEKQNLKYKPAVNQVESHPYLPQQELFDFCKANNIVFMAYASLGSPKAGIWIDQSLPKLLDDPFLKEIGKKYEKTAPQVAIRYNMQRGCVAIARSFNPDHIKENYQTFNFHMCPEDMEKINKLKEERRYWKLPIFANNSNYPFF